MNSGKYLYKVSAEKKIQNTKKVNVRNDNIYNIYFIFIIQKPQLKYITNETINHFKKFISKLYKKEEETLLNKKKKREEIKQKNKSEKRVNRNGYNQYNNNYYPGLYMPQMPPINNQNPAIMNDYQYYYYNTSYQFPPQMYGFPPYFSPFFNAPKSLQDSLNSIYQRGIVNNIIGSFFIKECQEKFKNNEKRKVPISMVELGDDQNTNTNDINENNNINGDNDNININKNDENKEKPIIGENNDNNNFSEFKGNNIKNENNYNRLEEKKNLEENKEETKDKNLSNNSNHEKELKKPDIIF